MTLYFEEEGDVKLPLECEALAKRVVEEALDYVGCPYEAEVNLLLTENAQIHEMNKEFRGIDRATDVLSFPMIDYPEPGTFDFLEEQEDYTNDPLFASLSAFVKEKGYKNGYVMWPVRTAVSGKQNTPGGATEIMEVLGKAESVERIKNAIELLSR